MIVLIPIAYASFDCSLTSNVQQCQTIQNASLNQSQKEILFSGLVYNAPIANVTNSIYIKDAWISLSTISYNA